MVMAGHSLAADGGHFIHRNAEGAVAGKAEHRHFGPADFRADDRREAVAAGAEQARRQIFAALFKSRIGIADGAVVADVRRDRGICRQARLNGAPGLARRHALLVAHPRIGIPCGARIILLMIHGGELLQPGRLGLVNGGLAVGASRHRPPWAKACQDLLGHLLGIAADADRDFLGQADPVRIDIDLDDLGVLRPVVDAIARQRRKRIEPRAKRQNNVGLGNQFHRRLRAVVAERANRQVMAAGKRIIVLVAAAHRRIQPFGQLD